MRLTEGRWRGAEAGGGRGEPERRVRRPRDARELKGSGGGARGKEERRWGDGDGRGWPPAHRRGRVERRGGGVGLAGCAAADEEWEDGEEGLGEKRNREGERSFSAWACKGVGGRMGKKREGMGKKEREKKKMG